VLKQERARNPLTIVAHAGDAISPSLMSSLDEGRHMMDLLGDLKLDVFVPGNHEFDFGPGRVQGAHGRGRLSGTGRQCPECAMGRKLPASRPRA
jgi:2',3'-cyclic-nucleotide 2'-phosphodiesterase (5'-nucleotidase family)